MREGIGEMQSCHKLALNSMELNAFQKLLQTCIVLYGSLSLFFFFLIIQTPSSVVCDL